MNGRKNRKEIGGKGEKAEVGPPGLGSRAARENPVFSERENIFIEKEVVERNKVEKRREAMGDLESSFPMQCGKICGKGENNFSFLFSTGWFFFSTEEGGKDEGRAASPFFNSESVKNSQRIG